MSVSYLSFTTSYIFVEFRYSVNLSWSAAALDHDTGTHNIWCNSPVFDDARTCHPHESADTQSAPVFDWLLHTWYVPLIMNLIVSMCVIHLWHPSSRAVIGFPIMINTLIFVDEQKKLLRFGGGPDLLLPWLETVYSEYFSTNLPIKFWGKVGEECFSVWSECSRVLCR